LSSSADAVGTDTYDGASTSALVRRLGVSRLLLFESVGSTLDIAHEVGSHAEAGTLILADRQTSGRGRQGRRWESPAGQGIWLTLIERPRDILALDVLSLRCGMFAAMALDSLAGDAVRLKWPNDLYVGDRKLAGILIETRWRGTAPDWVAIGFGLNVTPPGLETATGLAPDSSRLDALERVVPALRRAASSTGHLTSDELSRFGERDFAAGRRASAPAVGTVEGIDAAGELLIAQPDGIVSRHRTGSLTFEDPLPCS
jgi:BirA family biotin operon repressor/biotin-[acetyl-CoA-carboxylase] ligase